MSDQIKDTILLVDDDRVAHLINQKVLENVDVKASIENRSNAKDGFAFLQDYLTNRPNDNLLVILDIHMGPEDGFDLLDMVEDEGLEDHENLTMYLLTAKRAKRHVEQVEKYPWVSGILFKPMDGWDARHALIEAFDKIKTVQKP